MKIIRTLIAAGIIMISIWLYWKVIPTLGMFHLLLDDTPATPGSSFLYIVDGTTNSRYMLEWVKLGWPLVWQEWPLVAIGVLFGWASGCPFTELMLRKFLLTVIIPEHLRQKISLERDEMRANTFHRRHEAECMLNEAKNLYADAQLKQQSIAADQRRISNLRITLEEQAQNAGQLQRDLASTKDELARTKVELAKTETRNKKLKKKLRARLGKWIDEAETEEIL